MEKGREAIFWQTQKTARTANPGGRIPRRRTLADAVTITVDTRERYPYRFAQQGAETVRATVPAGDYAVSALDGTVVAAVERKSLDNLAATLSDGTLAFQMQRLSELPSPTSSPGSRCATPKCTSSLPTPIASPKTGPTASSPPHSLTRPTRAR
jgi:hypothetical protein